MLRLFYTLCLLPFCLFGFELQYDLRGNLIQCDDTYYSYDANNQLTDVVTKDHHIVYAYDEFGRRESRCVNGVCEFFLHAGSNEFAVFDEEGNIKELRVAGRSPHKDLFLAAVIQVGKDVFVTEHDSCFNLIKLINIETGKEIEITFEDPFGGDLPKDAPTRWIFSGKPYDAEADLVYFGSRYYSPKLKQWLTPDPAEQYPNPYIYCNNDPLSYFDPDGEFALTIATLTWGAGMTISLPVVGGVTAGAVALYGGYKGCQYLSEKYDEYLEEKKLKEMGLTWEKNEAVNKTKEKEEKKIAPPKWEDLGDDPTKCPGEGYVWRGNGPPGSSEGNWVRGKGPDKERFFPDLDHKAPVGPHWDYWGPGFEDGIRIKPDGTWEHKEK